MCVCVCVHLRGHTHSYMQDQAALRRNERKCVEKCEFRSYSCQGSWCGKKMGGACGSRGSAGWLHPLQYTAPIDGINPTFTNYTQIQVHVSMNRRFLCQIYPKMYLGIWLHTVSQKKATRHHMLDVYCMRGLRHYDEIGCECTVHVDKVQFMTWNKGKIWQHHYASWEKWHLPGCSLGFGLWLNESAVMTWRHPVAFR